MKLRQGNMWSVFNNRDLFLVTTNSTLTASGRLVMGAGMARQALDKFPDIDLLFGNRILAGSKYGLLLPGWPTARLGCFQTKTDWRQHSTLTLIIFSVGMLAGWCSGHPEATVALNFPGIGLGGLQRHAVLPWLELLPDTVEVWERS